MVKSIRKVKLFKNKRFEFIEFLFAILVVVVILVVIGKYTYHDLRLNIEQHQQNIQQQIFSTKIQSYTCPSDLKTIHVKGGKVCRPDESPSLYLTIFDTYPFRSSGKEQIYNFFSQGNLSDANKIMNNIIPVDRYEDTTISPITWNEDPYKKAYWRFEFYGFRPFINLIKAYSETGNSNYLKKAEEITLSFIKNGNNQPHAWDDYQAVSFRTMYLVKLWWQLRENNLLTYSTNQKILQSIQTHAAFLADPNHYDRGYDRGLNETAALYLVSVNFPDFPQSTQWHNLSIQRLGDSLENAIDSDGVLTDNSPYYQFYTLEKYWEVYQFSQKYKSPINNSFGSRLDKMINYSVYILQPNGKIPLLGASIDKQISDTGIYRQIADEFPQLRYVLTDGKKGERPSQLNATFPSSREVIMRSDWGKGSNFLNQTQILFEGGASMTNHSDLDSLSFSLYGNGINLMPDAGLYTYTLGKLKDYFHGTAGHNVVMVDDMDQEKGFGTLGKMIQEKNFVSQSAENQLNKGVDYQRNISLISNKYEVVVDKLTSDKPHLYSQIYHLFPGAKITTDGTTVRVYNPNDPTRTPVMSIYEVSPTNNVTLHTYINQQTGPIKGLCSQQYDKLLECYQLEYQQKAQNATYITLIEIGAPDKRLNYAYDGNNLHIKSSTEDMTIAISSSPATSTQVVSNPPKAPSINPTTLASINPSSWDIKQGTLSESEGNMYIHPSSTNNTFEATQPLHEDLSKKNILLRTKVENREELDSYIISLSTNNWQGSASYSLKSTFHDTDDKEWINISLGKTQYRNGNTGQWIIKGQGFDWSNVDAIKITVKSKSGVITTPVSIDSIEIYPEQKQGEVVIVFDDGYRSILPVADVLKQYGFKANLAAIADRIQSNLRDYLSVQDLHTLQDKYGWNIVNHSQHHFDAITTYYDKNDMAGFEQDVLSGVKFLEDNNLNSAPDWYIYPHGATNQTIRDIVGKYYTFARSTLNAPETFPFGEPLAVKTIPADSIEVSDSGQQTFTPLSTLENAVLDAKKYNTALFITFHRIHSTPTDGQGYNFDDFKQLVQFIYNQKISVETLQEFDTVHGIPEKPIVFNEGKPSEIVLKVRKNKFFSIKKLFYSIEVVFHNLLSQ